jgi:Holliday junction DNA helicase RuvA
LIGRLRGTLVEKQPPHLILDVNGIGYEVEVPMTTLYRLPAVGEPVTLHTHLVVREDAQLLYGFAEKRERELFHELVRCVQAQDTSVLVRIPGVGKKTAERLLVELKDRFKAWESMPAIATFVVEPGSKMAVTSAENDAVSALISLGFKPQEASRAVSAIQEDDLSSEEMIRRALKGMV